MSLVRALTTSPLRLTRTYKVDEQLTDASGPVTVDVARLDGTAVAGSPFTATQSGTGVYYISPTPSLLTDTWVADWNASLGGAATKVRDFVEWVGAFIYELSAGRPARVTGNTTQWTTADLATRRIQAENDCEALTRTTWVPRFKRVALSGRGDQTIVLPHSDIRAIRAVKVDGTVWTQDQIDNLWWYPDGTVTQPSGWWPPGARNCIVEYEHGRDYADPTVSDACSKHGRILLTTSKPGTVPANAISFTAQDGGTYRISAPAVDRVGVPEIDGIYARWGSQQTGGWA